MGRRNALARAHADHVRPQREVLGALRCLKQVACAKGASKRTNDRFDGIEPAAAEDDRREQEAATDDQERRRGNASRKSCPIFGSCLRACDSCRIVTSGAVKCTAARKGCGVPKK